MKKEFHSLFGKGMLLSFALVMLLGFNVQAAPSPTTSPTTGTTQPATPSVYVAPKKTQEAIVHKVTPVAETYKDYNYALVYNYEFYRASYPDLVAAFGDNKAAYLQHFVTNGMSEGRQACAQFNVKYYREAYADLQAAFGSDLKSYYQHFINNGYSEGRIGAVTNYVPKEETATANTSSVPVATGKRTKVSARQDVSKVYNYAFYRQNNPDLQIAFGNNVAAYRKHFIENGMAEGRQGTLEFNLAVYRKYQDLVLAFGDDYALYYLHYINSGMNEGRISK